MSLFLGWLLSPQVDMVKRSQMRQGVQLCRVAADHALRARALIPDMPRVKAEKVSMGGGEGGRGQGTKPWQRGDGAGGEGPHEGHAACGGQAGNGGSAMRAGACDMRG